jgi:hypothetical protein
MKRLGVRLLLATGFMAAAGAAGYRLYTLDALDARARTAQAVYDAQDERATAAFAEVRSGLAAYVAAGQRTETWAPGVAAALARVRTAVAEMQHLSPAHALDTALQRSADLERLDVELRRLVSDGKTDDASALVFAEGLEMLGGAATALAEARAAERGRFASVRADLRRQQAFGLAGALAAALLVILVLVPPVATREDESGRPASTLDQAASAAVSTDVRPARAAPPLEAEGLPPATEAARPAMPASAASVDLAATADVCTALGRLSDASTLPGLLERAAGLMSAQGLTLWMADPTGATLYPTAAHGYPAQTLARLSGLHKDDDNATSTAFRTSSLQIVKGEAGQAGALVVPLVGADGCVGVMAAEIANRREQDTNVQALARILGAQLAGLLPAASNPVEASQPLARADVR